MYNWVNEDSFGSLLPENWQDIAARINAALEAAGIPETGDLTPEQYDEKCAIWETMINA